jgi:hypothetical protein
MRHLSQSASRLASGSAQALTDAPTAVRTMLRRHLDFRATTCWVLSLAIVTPNGRTAPIRLAAHAHAQARPVSSERAVLKVFYLAVRN